MQRGFRGDFCPQNVKTHLSKTLEKSIISDQNKNFFKILKKSVAKIVRFFCAHFAYKIQKIYLKINILLNFKQQYSFRNKRFIFLHQINGRFFGAIS